MGKLAAICSLSKEWGRKMNEIKYNFYGCLSVMVFVSLLFLGGVYLVDQLVGHWVTYESSRATVEQVQITTTGTVDIARLGAQRDITVGCMQYSWVTSSPVCMLMGGVNGFNWARWGLLGVALTCGVLWYRGRK